MIDRADVFDAVRRGYSELNQGSPSQIVDYFDDISAEAITGHVSNIKGILFEQMYVEQLADAGIQAAIFEATNHPTTDVAILDNGEIINELQLKATESVGYITASLAENPDVQIVATSEVAGHIDSDMVIDSGLSESILENSVLDVVNPVSPLSVIGWLFGIF